VVYYNSEAENLMGPFHEGYRFSQFLNILPDDLEKAKDYYGKMIAEEESHGEVILRVFPPGRENSTRNVQWLLCRATRIQYLEREAILMNMMDITRTIELERQAVINIR
jgi:hypothetical protein